jgi:selenocysteine lyase/cysteine desulfurase
MPGSRRRFLGQMTAAVAASVGLPNALAAARRRGSRELLDDFGRSLAQVPVRDEAYWRVVRGQFAVRDDLVLMNAANLCPSPRPVQQRVFELTRDVDRDASFQNRGKFGGLATASREALARLMGADADEVAVVRNTSSANATLVNGLDLGPGDEVVLWEQNHPTNNVAWDVRAARRGFTVRRVSTPSSPTTAEALLEAFAAALSPRTRVLSFSHISNVSGVGLPAAELCGLARDRGVFVMIDGAQTFGALQVDLHALGCDAYTGSAHKWLVGPREAGLLYVRREWQEALWPTHVGVGWEGAVRAGARKFEVLGQRDDAAVAAVETTVAFHEMIGPADVESRVRQLAAALRGGLRERVPGVRFHTPEAAELSGGVVIFSLAGVAAHRPLFERLYEEHGIAGAPASGAFEGLRLCPHIYNTLDQVERAVAAVATMA